MFSDIVNGFECLMVRIYPEFRGPKVTVEALDSPGDAPGFEVKGCPVSLVVEGGAVDEQDGTDRTVRLLLLEVCARVVLAGVAVQAKRTGVVGNGIPVRVDQDRQGGEFLEELANNGFHGLGKHELNTLF